MGGALSAHSYSGPPRAGNCMSSCAGQFILLMIWDLQEQMNLFPSLLETCCWPAKHLVLCAYRFVHPGEPIKGMDTSFENKTRARATIDTLGHGDLLLPIICPKYCYSSVPDPSKQTASKRRPRFTSSSTVRHPRSFHIKPQ